VGQKKRKKERKKEKKESVCLFVCLSVCLCVCAVALDFRQKNRMNRCRVLRPIVNRSILLFSRVRKDRGQTNVQSQSVKQKQALLAESAGVRMQRKA